MVADARRLHAELAGDPDADSIAQAAACAAPILAAAPASASQAIDWLSPQLVPWEQSALDQARVLSTEYSVPGRYQGVPAATPHSEFRNPHLPPAHIYDHFLHRYQSTGRKRHGVFFTPQPIADFIVAAVDRLLREEFQLASGLATQSTIHLDPACGTGVFFLAEIDYLHCATASRDWNDLVNQLLPRLIGIEVLPAAALLAKLNIALKLAETGYDFRRPGPIQIITGDALSPDTS